MARAAPDLKNGLIAMKLAGASSHAVAAAGRKRKSAEMPEADKPKAKRVTIPLPKVNATVTVTGETASLDGLIAVLTESLEAARKAHREGISLATAQRGWADRARAKKAGA